MFLRVFDEEYEDEEGVKEGVKGGDLKRGASDFLRLAKYHA
jgi:hypothetical protein